MAEGGIAPAPAAHPPTAPEAPTVSVVIICYNHGRFLGEAIESVLGQTFRDREVIVVDDGSTDDTAAVVRRYATVGYVHQRNQGMAAARNTGLRHCRGCYVSFLDADDRLLPEALSVGVDCLENHREAAFVSGHYGRIDVAGRPIPTPPSPCVARNHYEALLRENYIGMHATVLFRREAVDRVSGFDRRLQGCDDYDIYLRIARLQPVYCHPRVVAEYRWHGGNTSRNWRLMLRCTLRALHRQRRNVRGSAGLTEAYRAGVRKWRHEYGDPLLRETFADLRRPNRWWSGVLGLLALIRYHPRGLARRFVARVSSVL